MPQGHNEDRSMTLEYHPAVLHIVCGEIKMKAKLVIVILQLVNRLPRELFAQSSLV